MVRGNCIVRRECAHRECGDSLCVFSQHGWCDYECTQAVLAAAQPAAFTEKCGHLDATGGPFRRIRGIDFLSPDRPVGASHAKVALRKESLQPSASLSESLPLLMCS